MKKWFDKHSTMCKMFEVGDLVLKWDKLNEPKGKHTKFQHLWLGPFQVAKKLGLGTYKTTKHGRGDGTSPCQWPSIENIFLLAALGWLACTY
jgi:hypothetical protein